MKNRNAFLIDEAGFTVLETIMVLGIIAIILSFSIFSMNSVSDRNIAIKLRHESSNTIDVSKGYLLSTASPESAELTSRLEKVLDGYTTNVYDDRYFIIQHKDDKWTIKIAYKIDEGLKLESVINPETEAITIKGISSDTKRIENLLDEGVIDE